PPEHHFKCGLSFDARQCGAKAEVGRPAECEMSIVGARNIKSIRIWEAFRIAIARGHNSNHSLPLGNSLAAKRRIFWSESRSVLAWALISQHLLHGRRYERRIIAKLLELIWISQQSEDAIAD